MDVKRKELKKLGEDKIKLGKELIERLNVFKEIPGIIRIQRKISTEVSSLQNVNNN